MSSFLCFVCHSTVNSDTSEDIRDKYREVIGMNLCLDSHLCHICCHMLNKLWLFKAICLKRSLEYPVLFSEKGAINLQRNDTECHILCSKDTCHTQTKPFNCTSLYVFYNNEDHYDNDKSNEYVELQDDRNDLDDYVNQMLQAPHDFRNEILNEHEGCNENILAGNYENNVTQNNEYANLTDNELDYVDKSVEMGTDIEEVARTELENNSQTTDVIETQRHKRKKSKRKESGFKKKLLTLEEQKLQLEKKRKQKEYLEAEFKCYNCALGFLFKDTYQAHMMRHEESNGEYRCEVCTLRFASQAVLRAHKLVHARGFKSARVKVEKERNTPCHLCGRVFRDASGLQQHLKRFHHMKTSNRTYPCSVCGKVYNNQAAVRTHLIKHINRKFVCEQCNSTFSSPYTLNQHKKRHETPPHEQHYCDVCQISYTTRKSLLAHRRNALVHQQTVFECPICGRVCPNKRSLTSHINTVHSVTKDHPCHLCRARYTSRKSLVRHIAGHTKPPPRDEVVCHRCPRTFKTRSKLNRHLREVCEKDKLEEELAIYYQE